MRRKLLFLVLAGIVIIGILVFFRFFIFNRASGQGVLKVTTNTAAKVLLENRELGRTPFEEKVAVGTHAIRLIPEGNSNNVSSWQGNVVIGSNVLTYVNRDLSESELTSSGEILWLEKIASQKAELTVTSVPDGGEVRLDDESKGISPVSIPDVAAGDHTLMITSPGFEPRTIKVKLTNGYKLTASLSLALSPSQMIENSNPIVVAEASISATPSIASKTTPTKQPTVSVTPTPTKTAAKVTPTKSPTPTPTKGTAVQPKTVKILDTPTGFLRVRKEPSTVAEEVGRVKPGEEYSVLDMSTVNKVTWYKITYTETTDGWISGDYAEKVN